MLSLVAIVMVLYIHTYYTEGEHLVVLGMIETMLGQRLCLIAVPMFYAISGYLFFLKMSNGVRSIGGKLRKRVRTLLVPYLLANVLTFLFYVILNCITMVVPAIDSVVNFKIFGIIEQGIWPTLKLMLIDPPVAFQMWFVRDLMVVMLFSPIIFLVINSICKTQLHWGAIVVLVVIYMVSSNHWATAAIWFSIGGLLAIHPSVNVMQRLSLWVGMVIAITTIAIIVLSTVFAMPNWVNCSIVVFGIPAVWLLFDHIYPRVEKWDNHWLLQKVCPYTFFIYLSHEPLLNIFKKLPLLVSRSEQMFIVCYALIPLVYVAIACIAGGWISKHFSRLYNIYTGGR